MVYHIIGMAICQVDGPRARRAHDGFELGVRLRLRRDLQAALLAEGYRVRVYVPYGKDRFAYVRRRLGERPSSVAFVLRAC